MSASETYFAILGSSAAAILLSYSLFALVRFQVRRAREPSVQTQGQVIKYEKLYDDGARYFTLIIQFKDIDGVERVITDTRGSFPAPYIGENVRVIYPRADPSRAWVPKPLSSAVQIGFLTAFLALALWAMVNTVLS